MTEVVTAETSFHYPPLLNGKASVRLLKLLDTNESQSAILSCELHTFELENCPLYKALSYTWGSPLPSEQIFYDDVGPHPSDEELRLDWGEANNVVVCNGNAVKVFRNLFDALAKLSDLGEKEFLWIDRLCIDQGNNVERASQVALMDRIYSKAEQVIVWLGRQSRDTGAAMLIQNQFAGRIYDLAVAGKLSGEDIKSHTPEDTSVFEKFGLGAIWPQTWFLWTQFFRRTWWYRRWTLQETALAKRIDVLCGEERFDWDKLNWLADYLKVSGWNLYLQRITRRTSGEPVKALLPRMFLESLSSTRKEWRTIWITSYGAFNAGTVMTELLYRSSMLQCSDPRDIIYSVLGIIKSMPHCEDTFNSSVDYNIDAADLILGVTRFCLEKAPVLAILSLVQIHGQHPTMKLPSWVPDLYGVSQHPMDRRLGLNRWLTDTIPYNAGFASQEVPSYRTIKGPVLHLRGVPLGSLTFCSIDLARGETASVAVEFLSDIEKICQALPFKMRNGQDRTQSLWRTLVADSEDSHRPAPADLEACFHDWILYYFFYLKELTDDWPDIMTDLCSRFNGLSHGSQSCYPLPDLAVGHEWWTRLRNTSKGQAFAELKRWNCVNSLLRFQGAVTIAARRLFATTDGDIGYGPLSSVEGDQVWVLENGRVPFILRPTQGVASFELVGECYVHGIMDGELLANGPPAYIPLSII